MFLSFEPHFILLNFHYPKKNLFIDRPDNICQHDKPSFKMKQTKLKKDKFFSSLSILSFSLLKNFNTSTIISTKNIFNQTYDSNRKSFCNPTNQEKDES